MTAQRMTVHYRVDSQREPAVKDVDLRDRIQRIPLEFPAYGHPRITEELKRQGWGVTHKRVGRIMREDNLLLLPKRKFHISTDSKEGFRIYPNLTRNFVPVVPSRFLAADITYVLLREEFVFMAVVLDA